MSAAWWQLCRESCRQITETNCCAADPFGGRRRGRDHGHGDRHRARQAVDTCRSDGQAPSGPAARERRLWPRSSATFERNGRSLVQARRQSPTHWTTPIWAAVTWCWNRSSRNGPAKQALYAAIRPRLADGSILATNTSTIPIARLAAGLADPGRFCGLHFCHPGPPTSLGRSDSRPGDKPGNLGNGRGPCLLALGSCRWSLRMAPGLS